jgi:hypothetical protein
MNDSKRARAANAVHRILLDIFDGAKRGLGLSRLDRWSARKDAAANLRLARELQRHPALAEAGKRLEASALKVLR